MNLLKSNLPLKIKIKFAWIYVKVFIKKFFLAVFSALKLIVGLFLENPALPIFAFLIAAALFAASVLNTKCKYDSIDSNTNETVILKDTNLNIKRDKKTGSDTIYKLVDRIIYKKVPPKYIYYTRVDSNLLKELPQLDLITNLEMDGGNIKIFAVRAADSTIKEYEFADVGPYFTVTSQNGNIHIKARRAWWNGIYFKPEYELYNFKSLKIFDKNLLLGLETDFNIGTRFCIGINPKYDTRNKDFRLNAFIKIKF